MKTLASLLAAVLTLCSAAHAQKVNTAIAPEQLVEIKDFLVARPGDVVKLMILSRGPYDKLEADGTIHARVSAREATALEVIVPPELTAWFRTIGDHRKPERSPRKVYGIVNNGVTGYSGPPFVKLIGREIRGTAKGREMLW